MKKLLLGGSLVLSLSCVQAQSIIDTVSIGAAYANQVWYSLENDNQGSAPKNTWDIAFDVSGQGSTIFINSVTGTTLWLYPAADTSGWNTVDTTGITAWPKRWNSDTSWAMGALGRYRPSSNPYDVDWGIYSPITHVVTGDSLYIIKLSNGSCKKLWIENLNAGVYTFRYANLDGSNLQNATFTKSGYSGQNFGYYSVQTNTALAREPLSANWDLLFTQYTAFIPGPYTVAGILQNKGVKVAEVKPIANPATYSSWWAHNLTSPINVIGYDWKVFTSSFVIEDSLVYFVQSRTGDIWKIIPTGFGGGSNGNYIFSKEKLSVTSVKTENVSHTLAVYPNPCMDQTTLLVGAGRDLQLMLIQVSDLTGKIVHACMARDISSQQLTALTLDTRDLENGVYMIHVMLDDQSIMQKLIVTR